MPDAPATARARRLLARALRRARLLPPRVTVLVVGDDPAGLDATLDTVRSWPRADLAVVVAASGDAARTGERHAVADWRVRALPSSTSWPDAARGARRSRLVVTLGAGDLPDLGSLERAIDAGPTELLVGAGPSLADPGAAVFDRRTWRRVQGAPSRTLALAAALAHAPRAARRMRPPGRADLSVRGMDDTRADLEPWLTDQDGALRLLAGDRELQAAWATSVLAGGVQRFLLDAERFDERGWDRLQAHVAELARVAGPPWTETLPAEPRVRVWLAATNRRADLVRFVADRRFEAGQFRTRAADGAVHAVLPVPADAPDDLLRLTEAETGLRTVLRRLRRDNDRLTIEVFAAITNVDLREHEPAVSAALVNGAARVPLDVELATDREATRWMGAHHVNHDRAVLRATVPAAALSSAGLWRLEVSVRTAGLTRTVLVDDHDPGGSVPLLRPQDGVGVELRPELGLRVGGVPADTDRPAVVVADVVVTADRLVVRGSNLDEVEVRGPAGPLERLHGAVAGAEGEVTWSLRHDPWLLGEGPVPPGRYVLAQRDGSGLGVDAGVGDRLPEVVTTDAHRVVVRRAGRPGGHALVLSLGPPLADDEVGVYCQRRLQEWYADPEAHRLDPQAVYFQAYTGQHATDSPLAVAEELARTRPDLTRTWAVADRGSRVPPGSGTVLWRSRAWYAALARSRYVVTNIELESWFRRRPGQEVLQTFHGYPSKAMGIGLWRQKRFTESRIEQQLDRTSRNWSLLLTPAPEMDVHYREQYRYDGPILAAGYPRDDALVGPAAGETRERTRARLGIAPGTVAVLYAPTWRDDQATDFRSARLVDHLDVAATAEALGPDHVLLLRGHRFMAAARPAAGGSRVLDVTSYPEVNDLLLAADVAVLDYSSMRFDFALTRRPMLFLVPDLDDYATTKRGFLHDFRPTAPGPLLATSAEVIAALRDLDGVRARHREDLERFNATFNRFQDGAAAARVVARFFA